MSENQVAESAESADVRAFAMWQSAATVSDWLGTAATAASVAAMYLHDVRNGVAGAGKLQEAREQLVQALEETDEILGYLAYRANVAELNRHSQYER